VAESAVLSIALDAAIPNRAEPPSRAPAPTDPYRALPILKECSNIVSSEFHVLSKLAIFPTCKPFQGADPKSPVARNKQASNVAVGEMLTGWRLPRDIPDAIEAK